MLAPLNVPTQPAPPTLATADAASVEASTQPQTALARVCRVEHVAIRERIERENGPSLYTVELFLCALGKTNAIFAPKWDAHQIPEDREADVRLEKTFRQVFQLHDAVYALGTKCAFGRKSRRCGQCEPLYEYLDAERVGAHTLNRLLMNTTQKLKLMHIVVAKFVYFLVRTQRPPQPRAPPVRLSCMHEATIAKLVAKFLEL